MMQSAGLDKLAVGGKRMPSRYRYLVLACVVAVLLFPFESTVVPAWKVRVVDPEGRPVKGIAVKYHWQHYSVEFEGNEERTHTDEDGYVSFRARTVRASLIRRVIVPVVNILSTAFHASFGPSGHIVVWGRPDEFETAGAYSDGDSPLAEQIVLERME
jgi:hypothetical protein